MNENKIAQALWDSFTSVNVPDENLEPANLVDVVYRLANVIEYGFDRLVKNDSAPKMGALEAHAAAIKGAASDIASALILVSVSIDKLATQRAKEKP